VARVTTAKAMPDGEAKITRGNVIILSAEDDVADTIRPRLEAAGANIDRVYVIKATKLPKGAKRTFDLTQDLERLERKIEEIGDVVLVVIDPYSAYMGKPGKIDSYRSTDVRAVLTPLCEIVGRHEVAVIGIGHLNKTGAAPMLLRVLDSIAFVAASRGVYLVVRDPEDDEKRMMLPAKNNIGRIRTGLAFKIILKEVPKLKGLQPAIEWQDGAVEITADEALATKPEDGRKSEDAERAKKIIVEMLVGGPRLAKEIEDRITKEGISKKSLRTAKKGISVRSEKVGTVWWWAMPGQEIEGM
jgi:putative DNA primase/helicase